MTLATHLALSIIVDVVLFPVKVALAGGAVLVSAVASLPGALAALGSERAGGQEVERAGGETACTAGDPAALDADGRMHFGQDTALAPLAACDAFDPERWTGDRAVFTADPHRCPECYRRLFPEVDA